MEEEQRKNVTVEQLQTIGLHHNHLDLSTFPSLKFEFVADASNLLLNVNGLCEDDAFPENSGRC